MEARSASVSEWRHESSCRETTSSTPPARTSVSRSSGSPVSSLTTADEISTTARPGEGRTEKAGSASVSWFDVSAAPFSESRSVSGTSIAKFGVVGSLSRIVASPVRSIASHGRLLSSAFQPRRCCARHGCTRGGAPR